MRSETWRASAQGVGESRGGNLAGPLRDRFGRSISYLRISVTDRCNLRCRYCVGAGPIALVRREAILSLEEMAEVARVAVGLGINKVRLTGGEPLVRRGVVELVRMLAKIRGITDLAMTTNGVLLAQYAAELAAAGLQRVNVSLDTLDPKRYEELTGGKINDVLAGIAAAKAAGLAPIKLNCVVRDGPDEPDARDVAAFAEQEGLEVRFIRQMHAKRGLFSVVEGGSGGDCQQCNRLRLSSDGMVRPCLFSDLGFSVRELGAEAAIRRAVGEKPEAGGPCSRNWIRVVGG